MNLYIFKAAYIYVFGLSSVQDTGPCDRAV